jgi:signal transduction histidine kinase
VTDAQRTHLGQIDKAVRLQFALVDDLSDSARLEAGALRLSERQCSLREIVSEVAALARPDAERNGLTLSVEPGLPELYLWADDQRLLQVAMNLVSNAVKYTAAPGHVAIGYAVEGNGDVAIRVSDTGIGMTPLEARHALRPYVRIDNERTRDQPGTGLGLSIARGLVELHGGTLTIDSAPGKGTTVTVRLPDERVLGAMPMRRLAGE